MSLALIKVKVMENWRELGEQILALLDAELSYE